MSDIHYLPTSGIQPNPYQPRIDFDAQGLDELAASIKQNGLLQPIVVRINSKKEYELIAGERRLRACRQLGMAAIPALIIDADGAKAAQLALIENIQRQNLSAVEEAKAYLQMIRMSGLTQDELAAAVGKAQPSIANKLRLLNLSQTCQDAISSHQITERHGRALLRLNGVQQAQALDFIISRQLNVAQTESYIEAHYFQPAEIKVSGTNRCFGASTRIAVNTLKQAVTSIRKLGTAVEVAENDNQDAYIMTITIKK